MLAFWTYHIGEIVYTCILITDNYIFNQGKPARYWQNPKSHKIGSNQEPLFSHQELLLSVNTILSEACASCTLICAATVSMVNRDCWCNSVFHLSIQVNNMLQITNYWKKWIPLSPKDDLHHLQVLAEGYSGLTRIKKYNFQTPILCHWGNS